MKFILALLLTLIPFQALAVWEVVNPLRSTFSTSSAFTIPYATPTDLCMIGNPTKGTITIHHIRVSGVQTTAGLNPFYLVKRSTLDTCAETTLTAVSHDYYASSSYADIQFCTGAPSLGTSEGTIRGADVLFPAPGNTSGNQAYDFDFGPASGTQPIILHQNEMVALNFNTVAVPAGMRLVCEFTWQEQ